MPSRKRGFTLGELLVTVAIIGILGTIALTVAKKYGSHQTPDENVEYHGH